MEVQVRSDALVDHVMMQQALRAARHAEAAGEVPIGAVLAQADQVLAVAHNAPVALSDPTAHAEVLVLRQAAIHARNYRLSGTALYVTMEPCMMCVGALVHARVERVVYGCTDPKDGALGSMYDLGRDGRSNHNLEVSGGVCAEEAAVLLQRFFRMRRGA